MNPQIDDRPTLNLGHLCIPNVSASQDWLRRQGEQRAKSKELVKDIAKQYFPESLPDVLFEAFAQRVIETLDHQV